MEKYNKISSRMYKHIVKQKVQQKMQQKVQQKVHNNYVPLLIKRFVFTKLVESQVSGITLLCSFVQCCEFRCAFSFENKEE